MFKNPFNFFFLLLATLDSVTSLIINEDAACFKENKGCKLFFPFLFPSYVSAQLGIYSTPTFPPLHAHTILPPPLPPPQLTQLLTAA